MQSMRHARSNFSIAVLGNKFHAIGGFDGSCEMTQCETYDPVLNDWKEMADLNKSRRDHGVAVNSDRIFAVGGMSYLGILDCIEKYNSSLNMWLIIKHTLDPRTGCCVAVASTDSNEHSLFIVGGIDGSHCCHSSVKRLSLNTIDYRISSGRAMNEPRAYGGVAVL